MAPLMTVGIRRRIEAARYCGRLDDAPWEPPPQDALAGVGVSRGRDSWQ